MVKSRMPVGRVARSARLGRLAAGQAVRGVGTRFSAIGRTDEARRVMAERSALQAAQQIVTVLGGMKGAAMKLGQMLSVLDIDLIPESHREMFRQKLSELRDHAPVVAFEAMRKVIEDDLGPLSRVFTDFDEEPVAAASIGQVYRAQLRDGRVVAVKVKYPGVDAAVHADMRNLQFFSKLWKSILPAAADTAVLDEITRNISAELDYVREANTQHRVAARYRDHPFITVPDSIGAFCTGNVLVTEFLDGLTFDRIRQLPRTDRDRIGELVYHFYIGGLFLDHEFCADPHPGNIMLAHDGRVGFVDFGLYNQIASEHVDLERDVLRAAAEHRAEDIFELWRARGIVDADSGVTAEECLEYVWGAAGWHLLDEETTITAELASSAVVLAVDPRSAQHRSVRHQALPPEHVFSRRADLFTFTALGQLEATNNWHRLAREWMYGELPATEIGRTIARWRRARGTVAL
ncbi:ATP-binding protein [Nocardia donostiensis]|uniref:ATP-binding protein n=1 Tax=Nocardia donostiensis TaxID=1538463 RepID=A0A1W0B102_9NOCA|nr:ATP-binding protein [Nocardia donostiensis]OQS16154.1 ATP-binding protein [Nocardia donostiensis]OQS18604.1 ATP-binding protein [Nocardia donostiensis]